MSSYDDLNQVVTEIFSGVWIKTDAQVVPKPEDLRLTNDAKRLARATIIYADLAGSTQLVDNYSWEVAGEIYKSFLVCAARLIKHFGGEITAYDGDRIMGVFIGDAQTSSAARCALQINGAVLHILNPALKRQYPNIDYKVKHVVGIDTSEIRAARIGARGGNDLVWIGRAANHAAKLSDLDVENYSTWLTAEAYAQLNLQTKIWSPTQQLMWKEFQWSQNCNKEIHGSTWWVLPFHSFT